ncbi:hypothetical protein ACQKKX_04950 [Neorhizobium sp. NPDC001467]|uniref:hypothetical protein n=1 Tax=Neorhizobium sp. NPDC001467 TaxID=3390595 RepID=UPI003D008AA8
MDDTPFELCGGEREQGIVVPDQASLAIEKMQFLTAIASFLSFAAIYPYLRGRICPPGPV